MRGLCGGLLLTLVEAQIRISFPDSLRTAFRESHGIVYGTTATFGEPYYGERVAGQLLYGESAGKAHCNEDDYSLPQPTGMENRTGKKLANIVLVRRGLCTFVTKALVAESMGAQAVIVVDKESSGLTSRDIQHIVMEDDGWGSKVKIPCMLISSADGQKLIDAAKQGLVIVELAWDIPRGEVVVADFWMSSASTEELEFLKRFKPAAEMLKFHLQFMPHYHIFSLPAGHYQSDLCVDPASRHCSPDPDGPGPITGADVVREDVRQLCIWNVTARTMELEGEGATYSQEFWEYVTRLLDKCPVKTYFGSGSFGEECSFNLMSSLGIPVDQVRSCVEERAFDFLENERRNVAWSQQALRLNGWRYSGPLDPETVLKAVCAGFSTRPKECGELLDEYSVRGIDLNAAVLTFGFVVWAFGTLACFLALIFWAVKRHTIKSVRLAVREEVMLEVQSQMAEYEPLQDGAQPGRQGRSPAIF
mmetsp:Transcript_40835/g.89324  ORF Transcript_40835/g.89324 Transcript_40835/m.89324 type:complete len:476 (+) Transcript_40835:78-1505(+)